MKVCRKCGEEKPLNAFYPNKSCSLGVTGTCRICSKERLTKWYDETRGTRNENATKRNQDRKRMAVDRFGDKCHDCGNTYPQCVYQFHHLDGDDKDVNPSKAFSSITRMWSELSKCVMLCANCHMIRHYGKEAVNETTH